MQEKTYTISALAAEFDISASAIRYYEDKGLIRPGRTGGNQRLYSAADRARIKLILRGRRFGCTLDEISDMIGPYDKTDEKNQILKSMEYIEAGLKRVKIQKEEIEIFEKDLRDLKKKFLKRLKELN